MERSPFFAMLSRMKYINRWGLMRCARQENLSEHTLDVAYIAHALACLSGADPGRTVLCALYHDCSEIITGDLPTPIKYYNDSIRQSYKQVEAEAGKRLLKSLPQEMAAFYTSCFFESDPEILALVKAADKLSAFIKCIEELHMGNNDFAQAKQAQLLALGEMKLEAVDVFLENFLPAYEMTLDEMNEK